MRHAVKRAGKAGVHGFEYRLCFITRECIQRILVGDEVRAGAVQRGGHI